MGVFTYWGKLVPADQEAFPQQIGFGATSAEMYMSQVYSAGGYEDCRVALYVNRVHQGSMSGWVGHGYPMAVRSPVAASDLAGSPSALLTVEHLSPAVGKVWVELPFIPGRVWSEDELVAHRTAAPTTYPPKQPYWSQGRVLYKDFLYELTGGPFRTEGATYKDGGPATLSVYRDGKRVKAYDASMLGRVGQKTTGAPNLGRLEPEGLALTVLDGKPVLVLNFACGGVWMPAGALACYLYWYDLESPEARTVRGEL